MFYSNGYVWHDEPDDSPECKGRIYRCRKRHFLTKRGECVYITEFVPQKRLSCPGCEKCGYIDDYLSECMSEDDGVNFDDVEDGELYSLIGCSATCGSYDCEEIDFWLEYVKVKE